MTSADRDSLFSSSSKIKKYCKIIFFIILIQKKHLNIAFRAQETWRG